jgi:V/A-type H+/Na+-transporting ATPase subunit I
MIIPLKKYFLLGAKEDLDLFFKRAQEQGFLEFISITGKKAIEMPQTMKNLILAHKILRKLPVKNPYPGGGDLKTAQEIAVRILQLSEEIQKFHEQRRLLEAEIARVAIFGDFSMEDIDYIERVGHCKIQFFCMKTEKSHKTNFAPEVIYVGTEYDLDYFITVNPEQKNYPEMIEMRIDRPVGQLQQQLSFVKETLHQLEAELKGFAGHIDFLHDAFIEELNIYELERAKREVSYPLNQSVFAIEAWVPENKIDRLFSLIDGMSVYAEEIAIEPIDRVPTCMENKGIGRIGEDLVKVYDIPATTDKDPSYWVFFAFLLFFAIIIGDGGYGLLYLAIGGYLYYKFPRMKGQSKRLFKLFITLASACVIWGVLTSSFFGLKIDPQSALGRISIINRLAEKKAAYHLREKDDVYSAWVAKMPKLRSASTGRDFLLGAAEHKGAKGPIDYEMLTDFSRNILLEFSLIIGIIHVSLGLLRYLRRNLAGIGWIAFLAGGYLYFPSVLNATTLIHFLGWIDKERAAAIGLQLIYGGIGCALLLAFFQKKWKGFGEAAHLVQVFADILSYLRLYALGLAGAIMAETFNGIGEFIGLVAGVFAMCIGHGVNLMLSTMSGVIHGLRLNFIEWYHYCFEGGGRLFKPLMRIKK